MGGGSLLTGGSSNNNNAYQSSHVTRTSGDKASQEQVTFVSKVFASTEDYWTKQFRDKGLTYHKPTLVLTLGQPKQHVGEVKPLRDLSTVQVTRKSI